MDKTTSDKTFQTKKHEQNTPEQKPCEPLRDILYRGFCPGFCCTKIRGSRCV